MYGRDPEDWGSVTLPKILPSPYSERNTFQLKYLSEEAKTLGQFTRESADAVAYDLKAVFPDGRGRLLKPGEVFLVPTGVALWINNPGIVGLIYPRSGTGTKRGLVLANGTGVVDPDYQGQWFVPIFNRSVAQQRIDHGERIAQVVFTLVAHPHIKCGFNEVEAFSSETARGSGGFGSTGS